MKTEKFVLKRGVGESCARGKTGMRGGRDTERGDIQSSMAFLLDQVFSVVFINLTNKAILEGLLEMLLEMGSN